MTVSKGFDYTETVGGKPIFRIQAERTVGFGPAAGQIPNSYSLEGVSLTLYPEQGQGAPVTVRADKAQYDHRTNDAVLSGNVRWTDEKGALGETAKVEFHPSSKGGELLVPSPVHFSRGTFNVEAKSGRYDVSKRELALEGPIQGSGTGEGSAGLSSIASDRALYRREEGVIELAGAVSGSSRGGDRVDCDTMTLKTEQEGNHIEWARAEGNVRGVLAAAPGATPGAGPAVSAVERRYFAKTGALFFAPDGAARSLALTGSPARVEEGNRKVEADTIDVAFEGGHAAAAHARGKVRFDSPENRAESDAANVSFAASGEIASLELSGNVTTAGEGRSAKADKVVQVPGRGLWVLTGGTGGSATAETEGSKVSADRIEMDRNRRTLDATGNARAVFVPGKSKEKAADARRRFLAAHVRQGRPDGLRRRGEDRDPLRRRHSLAGRLLDLRRRHHVERRGADAGRGGAHADRRLARAGRSGEGRARPRAVRRDGPPSDLSRRGRRRRLRRRGPGDPRRVAGERAEGDGDSSARRARSTGSR